MYLLILLALISPNYAEVSKDKTEKTYTNSAETCNKFTSLKPVKQINYFNSEIIFTKTPTKMLKSDEKSN